METIAFVRRSHFRPHSSLLLFSGSVLRRDSDLGNGLRQAQQKRESWQRRICKLWLEMIRKSPNPPLSATLESIDCRHVVHDEYAVSPDGMKMFGVLDLEIEMHGARSDL